MNLEEVSDVTTAQSEIAEPRSFQTVFEDGLWDVLIGCYVLQLAIAPLLSVSMGDFWSSAVFVPFFGLVFLAIWLIRKYVVRPRIGHVKFGLARRARLRRYTIVMLVLNCVALAVGAVASLTVGLVPGWILTAGFAFVALNGAGLAAYLLSYARLYVYGAMCALSFAVGELLYTHWGVFHHAFPVTFGFTAAVIIVTGLATFGRFLLKHPLPEAEAQAWEDVVKDQQASSVELHSLAHTPARLMVLTYLYVVESADYVFLMPLTGLTWGNLSTHLAKPEKAGYVEIEKEFRGKKTHSTVHLTGQGRAAFREYKSNMQQVLDDLPD